MAGDPTIKVVNGWEPFYCDKPYTADYCPALRIGSGNQAGMVMVHPAYDKTTTNTRVHGGSAAQSWACAYVTCRGGVYRGQVVGYFEDGPAARAEVVFDTTSDKPRRLFWRDIGHLGRGFSTATLGAGGP